jgi:rhodanese-related sulfurtransferase
MVWTMLGLGGSLGGTGRAVRLSALALLIGGACQNPGDLTDAEKRARIDELYEGYRSDFPGAPEVTAEALARMLAGPEPPVLVDVRGADEREVSTLPGAVSREEFEAHPERFAGREVVTYCTIGYRSGRYAEELVEKGWKAHNLRGSIVSWTHIGGELDHGGAATRRVHVYGRTWNLVASGYEAVW